MAYLRSYLVIAGLLTACQHGAPPAPATRSLRPVAVPVAPPAPKAAAPPVRYTRACPRELVGIAGRGDAAAVKDFIQQNQCSGDAFNGMAHTALMRAADGGHLEVVRALIAAGADVNTGLSSGGSATIGTTALWYAIRSDHPDIVAELLHAGADPDHGPYQGLPLLVLAAMKETRSRAPRSRGPRARSRSDISRRRRPRSPRRCSSRSRSVLRSMPTTGVHTTHSVR